MLDVRGRAERRRDKRQRGRWLLMGDPPGLQQCTGQTFAAKYTDTLPERSLVQGLNENIYKYAFIYKYIHTYLLGAFHSVDRQ